MSKENVLRLLEILGESDSSKVPIKELWPSWANGMKQKGKSEATIRSMESAWKHLKHVIGEKLVEEITDEYWTNEILPAVRARTKPTYVFFNMRKWIRMFLKWAETNNKGPRYWHRPNLSDPDPKREPGRAYSPDEVSRLLLNADWLLKPKIIMGIDHFMRRSEISLLSKERVDRAKQIIHLRAQDTKIRKARSFPYSDELEECFNLMDKKHAELGIVSPFVFPSPLDPMKSIARDGFSSAWQTCKRRAKVEGKFHWCRHTGLTWKFKEDGANHAKICEFAGLRIDEAQKTYVHLETEDLRDVLTSGKKKAG